MHAWNSFIIIQKTSFVSLCSHWQCSVYKPRASLESAQPHRLGARYDKRGLGGSFRNCPT